MHEIHFRIGGVERATVHATAGRAAHNDRRGRVPEIVAFGDEIGELVETAGGILDKYYKWKESQATQVIHHNVTLQVVDQHISVFHDVIREVLSQMDLETSLYFMEVFNDKMAKLKMPEAGAAPTTEMKLAEAKLLNETINKKINEK